MKKESATIEALKHVFQSDKRGSWEKLNGVLSQTLSNALLLEYEIKEGDFDRIRKMNYAYWAGTSENGNHYGERHYAAACSVHRPAAIEYERSFERKPFILDGKRLSCGSRVKWDERIWKVTGWAKDNETLNFTTDDAHFSDLKSRRLKVGFDDWKTKRKEMKHV